jgi:hypothetical protein
MDRKQIKNFNILYWKFFDYIISVTKIAKNQKRKKKSNPKKLREPHHHHQQHQQQRKSQLDRMVVDAALPSSVNERRKKKI